MKRWWVRPIVLLCLLFIGLALSWQIPTAQADYLAQLPTGSLPTVTSTSTGPMALMVGNEPQANLRSGPGPLYERVGVMLYGQKLPARGRSPKGEWVQVVYPSAPGGLAWVYSYLVEIQPASASLPIVEPPPTPTPQTTATIDPTLMARFGITMEPERLPTFTNPAPLVIPTWSAEDALSVAPVPMGFIILGLGALGLFLGVVAFSQRG